MASLAGNQNMSLWSHVPDLNHQDGMFPLSLILGELVTPFLKGARFGTQGTLRWIVPLVRGLLDKLLVPQMDSQPAARDEF